MTVQGPNTFAESSAPAMDVAVVETLLNLGGPALRTALSAQLQVDFARLRAAIGAEAGPDVARAAHELKGLAATVGANRLTEMSHSLDRFAADLSLDARSVMVSTLKREIDDVLQILAELERGHAPA